VGGVGGGWVRCTAAYRSTTRHSKAQRAGCLDGAQSAPPPGGFGAARGRASAVDGGWQQRQQRAPLRRELCANASLHDRLTSTPLLLAPPRAYPKP
jgi:hypothetical protein